MADTRRKLFLGLGITFLILSVLVGGLLTVKYFDVKNDTIEAPDLTRPSMPTNYVLPEERAGRFPKTYEERMAEYNAEMARIDQLESEYQVSLDSQDDKAISYLLYAILSGGILLILSFISFVAFALLGRGAIS
jgi:hypothetical protein